jgi:hypothetical protein
MPAAKIRDLWLACYTQEEIAEACGCGTMTVNRKVEGFYHSVPGNKMVRTAAADDASTADAEEEDEPFKRVLVILFRRAK